MSPMHLLEPVFIPIAARELATRFDRASARTILDDAFADYDAQRPELPEEASVGGRAMVHLAALTVGLFRALRRHGLTGDEARSTTARVTRWAYDKMASVPTVISRIRARVKRATGLFCRFPFSAPSYAMVDVEGDEGVVAFDVRRCPVAEYFRAQGLGELCVESWCDLDYALAERWGARLERSHTIAGGAGFCNFRWRIPAVADAKGSEEETR